MSRKNCLSCKDLVNGRCVAPSCEGRLSTNVKTEGGISAKDKTKR